MKKKKKKMRRIDKAHLLIFAVAMAVLCTVFAMRQDEMPFFTSGGTTTTTQITTTEPTTTEPAEPYVISTATVRSAGDILIHNPVHRAAKKSDGTYDFTNIFTEVKSVMSDCDYFVINLETTLGGTDGREISGYPLFNSPDVLVENLKEAGVDCLLTANNHSYDSFSKGFIRTIEIIEKNKLDYTGTRKEETEPKYLMRDINGINFGFICYTYETAAPSGVDKSLNGISMNNDYAPLINSFDYYDLDSFYAEFDKQVDRMRKDGAEVIVAYPHWGDEYKTSPNSYQKEMARELCNMGVDVIIGGHPHVVEPVELLTSEDGKHRTVCLYSMGNIVSNQRRERMNLKTGHTEDGLIFEMTFSKYSDGRVVFDSIDTIPTWVHLYTENGRSVYSIVPLMGNLDKKAEKLGLNKSSSGLSKAKASYERTMELVEEGTKECNKYLKAQNKKLK